MRKQGSVVRWDASRGFGFIRSPATTADIFFHTRDFRAAVTPNEGLEVTFEEIHVGGKGPRAMAVQPLAMTPAGEPSSVNATLPARTQNRMPERVRAGHRAHRSMRRGNPPSRGAGTKNGVPAVMALLLMLAWVALFGWGLWARRLPMWLPGPVLLLNLLTFHAYWTDKYAAQKGQWRIKEDTLHLFGLLGGWPSAWFAHQILRHKSRKAAFRSTYWATVLLHLAALLVWLFWAPYKMF